MEYEKLDEYLLFYCFKDTNKCLGAPCGPNSNCTNTNGSYICVCQTGYERNGINCTGNNKLAFAI